MLVSAFMQYRLKSGYSDLVGKVNKSMPKFQLYTVVKAFLDFVFFLIKCSLFILIKSFSCIHTDFSFCHILF